MYNLISRNIFKTRKFLFSKKYSKDHEWMMKVGQNYQIGISDYAQDKLGEVCYLEFPEENQEFGQNDEIGEIESSKAVSVIYAPVDLTILKNNLVLEDDYSKINSDAENTWLYEVSVKDENQLNDLMDLKAYEQFIKDLK